MAAATVSEPIDSPATTVGDAATAPGPDRRCGGDPAADRRAVFVSYSRRDATEVLDFVAALRAAGTIVWIDVQEIDPLDPFPARIRDGIAGSHLLLAWYSTSYARSSYCQQELIAAWVAASGLTRQVGTRIVIVNPEPDVTHVALGDLGAQNFLAAPVDATSRQRCVAAVRGQIAALAATDGPLGTVLSLQPPVWYPEPRRQGSDRFAGRLHELWRVHTGLVPIALAEHGASRAIVQVTGIGGSGKSLLAIAYADRFGAAFPAGVFWLRGNGALAEADLGATERAAEFERQQEVIAAELGIASPGITPPVLRRLLAQRLAALRMRYLWIVDDLPAQMDWQAVEAWCAPSANGSTLLSTRSTEYEGLGRSVPLGPLDAEASLALLTSSRRPASPQEHADVQVLCGLLAGHPLALDVAGHFLLRSVGFAELRADLSDPDLDLLGGFAATLRGQLPGGHERSVVATLQRSVLALGPQGHDLLRLDGVLRAATPLPQRLTERAIGPLWGRRGRAARELALRAADELHAHSLATLSRQGSERDHLLVHAMARYAMARADPLGGVAAARRQALRESAVWALIDLLGEGDGPAWQPGRECELAHAAYLVPEPRALHEALLCAHVAAAGAERGAWPRACRLAELALAVLQRELGDADPDTLALSNDLALWTAEAGDGPQALARWRALLPLAQRSLVAGDRLLLRVRQNIALWTGLEGDPAAARAQLEVLQQEAVAAHGETDADTLTIRHNLAHWIGWGGDPALAAQLLRALLCDAEASLGPRHPLVRDARFNLAHWTGQAGDPAAAQTAFRGMLEEEPASLGALHPRMLELRLQAARWTAVAGDVASAFTELAALRPDCESVLGADHPTTLQVCFQLASWTAERGDLDDARARLAALLERQRERLGADHPDTLLSQAALIAARAVDAAQRAAAARELAALRPVIERVFGQQHPHVATLEACIDSLEHAEVQLPSSVPNFARGWVGDGAVRPVTPAPRTGAPSAPKEMT